MNFLCFSNSSQSKFNNRREKVDLAFWIKANSLNNKNKILVYWTSIKDSKIPTNKKLNIRCSLHSKISLSFKTNNLHNKCRVTLNKTLVTKCLITSNNNNSFSRITSKYRATMRILLSVRVSTWDSLTTNRNLDLLWTNNRRKRRLIRRKRWMRCLISVIFDSDKVKRLK